MYMRTTMYNIRTVIRHRLYSSGVDPSGSRRHSRETLEKENVIEERDRESIMIYWRMLHQLSGTM
jgi:hypothetical protein